MRIGVFPLGRSDGMETLSVDHVLVRGRRAPILVRPSLEHTRIDLSDIDDAKVGDEVVIIGRQGSAEIKPDDVTERLKMDPGELAVGLRGSISRRYLQST
jgi:alanine racemase